MNFQGHITKKEFTQALELHFSQIKWLKWICGLILVVILFFYMFIIMRNPSTWNLYLTSIIFPVVILSAPWWIIYLQSGSYDQKGNIYRTSINGTIDATGISINGQDMNANIFWRAFTHSKMNNKMVLLYQGKSRFNIFTSTLFTDEDAWKQFVEIVRVQTNGK